MKLRLVANSTTGNAIQESDVVEIPVKPDGTFSTEQLESIARRLIAQAGARREQFFELREKAKQDRFRLAQLESAGQAPPEALRRASSGQAPAGVEQKPPFKLRVKRSNR